METAANNPFPLNILENADRIKAGKDGIAEDMETGLTSD